METTCAVVRISDGLVMNTIMAAPSDLAPSGCELIEIMTGQTCSIGWYYVDGVFHGPRSFAICEAENSTVVSLLSASYIAPDPVAPEGYFGIEVSDDLYCDIGWTWDFNHFEPPVG